MSMSMSMSAGFHLTIPSSESRRPHSQRCAGLEELAKGAPCGQGLAGKGYENHDRRSSVPCIVAIKGGSEQLSTSFTFSVEIRNTLKLSPVFDFYLYIPSVAEAVTLVASA